MPLPAVLVAEFRMALTASCTADVELEVEDAVVPEVPRNWLSDGEEPLSKLDRSELIELVLIPLLLRRRTTSHLCYRRNRHSH
jgi:50S ribosomal subunit-associated GTPase HflX